MRNNLIEALANAWRTAENYYLDSNYEDHIIKNMVREIQIACNLTEEETQALEDIASTMGV